jgi:L-lactate dehydrogenase complex protein LldG
MSGREEILSRVREALNARSVLRPPEGGTTNFRDTMPAGGESFDERVKLFAANALALRAEFQIVRDWSVLGEIAQREGWKKIATHGGKLTDAAVSQLGTPCLRVDGGYDPNEMESCDAGITECEALISQTGGVLVSAVRSGGRGLSALPPHHVVLATADQLLPDLTAAFDLLRERYGDAPPSFISFVTGPSRTGDIERILVLGAHGPKKLTILLKVA